MANGHFEPQSTRHGEQGHQDIDFSVPAIVIFAVFLVVSAIASFLVVGAFANFLERWEKSHEARLSPVERQLQNERRGAPPRTPAEAGRPAQAGKPPGDPEERAAEEVRIQKTFAAPRLQYDDVHDMYVFRGSEEARLASTGQDPNGTIHIPISRAMDLLKQRGLPSVSGPFLPPLPGAVPTEESRDGSHEQKTGRGMKGDVSH